MVGSLIPAQSKVSVWSHRPIQLCVCSGKGQSAKAINQSFRYEIYGPGRYRQSCARRSGCLPCSHWVVQPQGRGFVFSAGISSEHALLVISYVTSWYPPAHYLCVQESVLAKCRFVFKHEIDGPADLMGKDAIGFSLAMFALEPFAVAYSALAAP